MKDINLFKLEGSVYLKKVRSKAEVSKDADCDGFLIESSEKEARRIIESLRSIVQAKDNGQRVVGRGKRFLIGIIGGNDAFNRRVVETLRIDYLVSAESGQKVDSLKQRDSGLNHVVAQIAKEKGIKIIVDVSDIKKLKGAHNSVSSLSGKEKALRLGRIIQNVKVCRKVGCSVGIASFGLEKKDVVDELGRKAFGVGMGMSSLQSRDCVKF